MCWFVTSLVHILYAAGWTSNIDQMDETDCHEANFAMTYGVYHVALPPNGLYSVMFMSLLQNQNVSNMASLGNLRYLLLIYYIISVEDQNRLN